MAAELLKGRVDTVLTNGVRWGGPIGVGRHLVALIGAGS
jgi:hypothetical protein